MLQIASKRHAYQHYHQAARHPAVQQQAPTCPISFSVITTRTPSNTTLPANARKDSHWKWPVGWAGQGGAAAQVGAVIFLAAGAHICSSAAHRCCLTSSAHFGPKLHTLHSRPCSLVPASDAVATAVPNAMSAVDSRVSLDIVSSRTARPTASVTSGVAALSMLMKATAAGGDGQRVEVA